MTTHPSHTSVLIEIDAQGNQISGDASRFTLHDSPASTARRVFTTFVANPLTDGTYGVSFLHEHLHRLLSSAAASGVCSDLNLIRRDRTLWALNAALHKYRSEEGDITTKALVRIVVSRLKIEILIDSYLPPWSEQERIDLITVAANRAQPHWKSTQTEASIASRRLATARGAHEALLVGSDGVVREGAWSNLFWVDRTGGLFTAYGPILPGIVRQAVLELSPCRLVLESVDRMMENARELFITQSTTGISPVRSVDGILLPGGSKVTSRLRDRFGDLSAKRMTICGTPSKRNAPRAPSR